MTTNEIFEILMINGVFPIKIDSYGHITKSIWNSGHLFGIHEFGCDPVFLLEDGVKAFIEKNREMLSDVYEEYCYIVLNS